MNNVHPTIAAALAPWAPRPPPTISFSYMLDGIILNCELDYESASPSSEFEQGYPESASLWSAEVGGVDIAVLLSDEHVAEIEAAFLKQRLSK